MAGWVERHDKEIRARLEQGDEDTIVNWMLFGTSFTARPRAVLGAVEGRHRRDREAGAAPGRRADQRAARRSGRRRWPTPGTDERRLFARALFSSERDLTSPRRRAGEAVRDYLTRRGHARRARAGADRSGAGGDERRRLDRRVRPAVAAVPHARPVARHVALPNYAIEQSLAAMKKRGLLKAGERETGRDRRPRPRFRRQGRRLRFLSSADAAAVCRSRFAPAAGSGPPRPADPEIVLLDISPRVIDHVTRARARAAKADGLHAESCRWPEPTPWLPDGPQILADVRRSDRRARAGRRRRKRLLIRPNCGRCVRRRRRPADVGGRPEHRHRAP